jgi:hypothetical protein
MKKTFIIRHPSQLNSLSTLPIMRTAGLGRIVLNETFQHPDKEKWEREINKRYYACGCNQGALALIIGLILFGVGGAFGYFKYELSISSSLTFFFVGSITMAVLGKFIGLIRANKELRKTVREVQSVWKPNWAESKSVGCG